jgi:hypothetical protein
MTNRCHEFKWEAVTAYSNKALTIRGSLAHEEAEHRLTKNIDDLHSACSQHLKLVYLCRPQSPELESQCCKNLLDEEVDGRRLCARCVVNKINQLVVNIENLPQYRSIFPA